MKYYLYTSTHIYKCYFSCAYFSFNFPLCNSEQQFTHAQMDTIELTRQRQTQFQTNFHLVYKKIKQIYVPTKSRSNWPQAPMRTKEQGQFCALQRPSILRTALREMPECNWRCLALTKKLKSQMAFSWKTISPVLPLQKICLESLYSLTLLRWRRQRRQIKIDKNSVDHRSKKTRTPSLRDRAFRIFVYRYGSTGTCTVYVPVSVSRSTTWNLVNSWIRKGSHWSKDFCRCQSTRI